jgi:hypothetical protein
MALSTACAAFPSILCLCGVYRLPLHIVDRVGAAAGERDDVIPDIAGTRAAGQAGRGAGVDFLKFPRHRTRSMLARGGEARQHQPTEDDQSEQRRVHYRASSSVRLISISRTRLRAQHHPAQDPADHASRKHQEQGSKPDCNRGDRYGPRWQIAHSLEVGG